MTIEAHQVALFLSSLFFGSGLVLWTKSWENYRKAEVLLAEVEIFRSTALAALESARAFREAAERYMSEGRKWHE